jgi:hypothetical protein
MQWPRAVRRFGSPSDVARMAWPEPAFPIAVMTCSPQRTDEGRRARAEAAADDGGYETVVRDIWV